MFSTPSFPYIPTVDFRDLSERDTSPDGKTALATGEGWRHAETGHFIYHFKDEKKAETVYLHAELYYGWVKELFGVTEDQWKKKSHIYVFEDAGEWKVFHEKIKMPERGPAFTTGWELFIYRDPFWLAPQKTLAHEITHVIAFRFLDGPIPLFLNEGFAEYIGYKAAALKADGEEYRVRTIQQIPADKWIPADRLARMESYPEDIEIFYRQAELAVRYLLTRQPARLFYPFLKDVSKGASLEKALMTYYSIGLEHFSDEIRNFSVSPLSLES